ncbi:ABC transporter permease [Candidatus Contubernalis alkaliaceticus]|uniref:ABC transporter permease n=1 Tax=Candidatus Contubernalis alkaliaceticus TaxID=338645 RepID=UPI001F4C322B|nr:ABC transporter permease [Candidatus Contubernalis alkalaceticus]UNC91084.1 ABC transporter permease [Candidatus Contubernalis alkalaceticus]
MNILNKLTLRNLQLNKKRTIVTIIGIIIASAMVCGTSAISASFQDLFVQSAIETDGNFHATFYDVSMDKVKYITGSSHTEESMLSRDLGYALFKESKNESKPYFQIKEYDHTAFTHMPVTLVKGRFPVKEGEAVISDEIYSMGGDRYSIGQTVSLDIGKRNDNGMILYNDEYSETENLENTAAKTYTITGFIEKPRFERGLAPGYTIISYMEEKNLTAGDVVNVSILGKAPKKIFETVPEMANNAEVENYIYNGELLKWLGISQSDQANQMFDSITRIIILLIAVGTIAVIYNSFAISVSERKKQFGMLSSAGASPGQIRRMVFYEGFLVGLTGIPLGILSGFTGIGITLSVVNRLMIGSMFSENIILRLVVSPGTILLTVFFVSFIIFLSAFIPARRAAGISPIDAIRLNKDIQVNRKILKTSRVTRSLFGIEGELALKNLKRNRRRYRATVFSLFISIVLFITFSSFMTYSFKSSEMYYEDIPYDIVVAKYNTPIEEQLNFFSDVLSLDGIKRYTLVRNLTCDAESFNPSHLGSYLQKNHLNKENSLFPENDDGSLNISFRVLSLGEKEFNRYAKENGLEGPAFKDIKNFQGILVNQGMLMVNKYVEYEPMNMKEGQRISLTTYDYSTEEATAVHFPVEIGGITETLPFGVLHSDHMISSGNTAYSNFIMVVSDEVMEEILRMFDSIHASISPQLYIESGSSAGSVVEQVKTLDIKYPNGSLYLQNISAQQEDMKRTTTVISIFLYGFVTLITLIGVTNIFNTISTNVALRRQEFAMLKSVGMTPGGFNKMIRCESLFYGLKALLYGLPVSILISYWMYNSFGAMFVFGFVLPWKEILFCVAGVFIIVFITMIHSSTKLKNENIMEALKEENL